MLRLRSILPWGLAGGAVLAITKVGRDLGLGVGGPGHQNREEEVRTARAKNRKTELMRAQVSEFRD